MKRLITIIAAVATMLTAGAMSYSQAREQAWFLTDKMAYELYLTAAQVDAVYEINLDYIMSVDVAGDIFGNRWERRTRQLGSVLTNSQMHTFLASMHFYRPIAWVDNTFRFAIYDRYPRTRFFATAPKVYTTYRGEMRNGPDNRFEGRFDNVKPAVNTSRPYTRTGATGGNNGGFTNPGNTRPGGGTTAVNNGNMRPGGGTTATPRTTTATVSNGTTRTGATTATTGSTFNTGSARGGRTQSATVTTGGSARRH